MYKKKLSEHHGGLLVISAAVLWGTTGTAQAFAPIGSSPPVVGALRLLVGGLALLLFAFYRDRHFYRCVPYRQMVIAGFFVAAYQLFFFWSVSLTGVAVGTIVGIGSSPIFAGILGAIFLQEKLRRKWYAATALGLSGCALLVGSSGQLELNIMGIALAAGAGLSYASYTLCIKIMLPGRSAVSVTAMVFCTGALLLTPLLVHADLNWVFQEPRGLLVVLHLGLCATALSYILFSKGLASTQISTAVTLSLAEPVTAGLLGVVILGEQLTSGAWCGVVGLLLGLILIALPSPRRL